MINGAIRGPGFAASGMGAQPAHVPLHQTAPGPAFAPPPGYAPALGGYAAAPGPAFAPSPAYAPVVQPQTAYDPTSTLLKTCLATALMGGLASTMYACFNPMLWGLGGLGWGLGSLGLLGAGLGLGFGYNPFCGLGSWATYSPWLFRSGW